MKAVEVRVPGQGEMLIVERQAARDGVVEDQVTLTMGPLDNVVALPQVVETVIYPVKDLAAAKQLYTKLLGVEPYMDGSYYVGFNVEGQDVGLDPNGHETGMTGPIGYWHVDDIETTLKALLDAGAQEQQTVRDVGGGKLIATVKDPDGNVVGILQASAS